MWSLQYFIFYLAIKMEMEQLLCKSYFTYSVWYFNKPCLQSFLMIKNYSAEIQKHATAGQTSFAKGQDS
jgi:hypothetical protein